MPSTHIFASSLFFNVSSNFIWKKTSLGVLTSGLKKNTIMVYQQVDKFFIMTNFHNILHSLAT